ncbi:MAG: isochorismate synthase [Proteobacteria bacterium]|nr:isochorismate synthase [Pseudomonadota bacterium]
MGASPERLYDRCGRTIGSDAMAGTRARGDTLEDDRRKADELIGSEKELREHRYVIDGVYESLSPLCESLERNGDPVLVKLARVQHLVARLEGVLRQGVDDGAILAAIHPTAAVAGFPRQLSVERIEQLEPFDRGWYAGPVGWIGRDRAEFAVSIRSGLIINNVIDLYSGAGIVEGSTPDSEWKEIENKIANFLKALRVDEA